MLTMAWWLNRLNEIATAHAQGVANVHAGVLSVLAAVWSWPWLSRTLHRMPLKTRIEWVRLWRCPQCQTLNYQTYAHCSHCEYHLKLGFWRRRMPVLLSEKMARRVQRFRTQYAVIGWIIFYGITAFLFWMLGFYRFPQKPAMELAASAVFILTLLGLWYLHRAFRLRWKSPLAFVMDGAAGVVVMCLAGFALLLWSSASKDLALAGYLARAYRWIPTKSIPTPALPAGSQGRERTTQSSGLKVLK